jgi:hypothetical protein
MPLSGMLRLVARVRTDVSEKHVISMFWVQRIRELGTALATEARC